MPLRAWLTHGDYDAEGNRVDRYVWTDADSDDEVDWNANEISNWTKYTWDHRNRLIRVESGATYGTTDVTVTFGYDFLNRWISTDVDYASADDTSEYFVYGGATLPEEVAPWDRAAVDSRDIGQITLRLDKTQKITNRYLWGPAVDQILADEQVDWNAGAEDYDIESILWPLTDHQGTVCDLAAVNEISGDTEILNTRSYDAYGNLLAETAPAVDHLFGFTARPTEGETDLQNNLNRWYDAAIGTWINEDLIGFEGGDANLYRYCGNDPVNAVDPSGLLIETVWDVGMTVWDIGCAVKNAAETTWHGVATGVNRTRGDTAAQAESWEKCKENAGELGWNVLDLAVDAGSTLIPGVPAGGSKAARALVKGGKEVVEEAPGTLRKAEKGADAAKGFITSHGKYVRRADNYKHALDPSHVKAAAREKAGEVVKRKPSGVPYDHLTETREAMQGAKERIVLLKKYLTDPTLSASERKVIEAELAELSTLLDRAEKLLGELAN